MGLQARAEGNVYDISDCLRRCTEKVRKVHPSHVENEVGTENPNPLIMCGMGNWQVAAQWEEGACITRGR